MAAGAIGDRRRPILDGMLLTRVGLAWVLVSVVLLATSASAIVHRRFPDGDDILRLLQVRDFLTGQSWFDMTQYRIATPDGAPMHWSRIVDIPLIAVIGVLTPLVGSTAAEHTALIVVPLITLFAVLLLIGRLTWRVFDEEATGLACLVAAMAMPLLHQLRPMRIDHHGWQVACALLAMNALMGRDARKSGWLAGGAMAAWLAISIEALPMVAALLAVGLWRWLRCWDERDWLPAMLQGLALGSLALYLGTHGMPTGSSACDAMSPAYIAAFGVLAIGATGLALTSRRPHTFTLLVLGSTGLAAIVVALAIAPQCAAGPFATIDPLTRGLWLDSVRESKPVWHQPLAVALQIVLPPMVALVVSLRLAAQTGDWVHRWHLEYAAMLAASLTLALFVSRAGAVAAALAAVPLGWQLKQWLRAVRNLHRPGKQAVAVAGMVAALAPAMPLTIMMQATPSRAAPQPALAPSQCDIPTALPALGRQRADVLAPIDMGPAILLASPHRVVATAHHRADKGIADTLRAFIGDPAQAHAVIARRGIDYVMICPGISEMDHYRKTARQGFATLLTEGKAPAWLEPVSAPNGSGVLIWKVVG